MSLGGVASGFGVAYSVDLQPTDSLSSFYVYCVEVQFRRERIDVLHPALVVSDAAYA